MNSQNFFIGTVCVNKDYFMNKAFLRANLINGFEKEETKNTEKYENMLLMKVGKDKYICLNGLSLKEYIYLYLNLLEETSQVALSTENDKLKHYFIDKESVKPFYDKEQNLSLRKVKKDYKQYNKN